MKKLNLMQKVDSFIYNEIEKLETNEGYQKLSDSFSALEENVQKAVKIIIMISIIAIPALIILLIKSSNTSLQNEVEIKKDLVISANSLIRSKNDIKRTSRFNLSPDFVDTSSEIKQKVLGMLNITGIDSTKVKISGIDITPEANLITKIKADVKFDNMDNNELFNFIKNLSMRLKVRVDEVSIKKNSTTNLLDGVFTIHYLSKAPVIND